MGVWTNGPPQIHHCITLHYIAFRHFKRHLYGAGTPNWCINDYMLYEILPTGPARRLATQQIGHDQEEKSAVAARIAVG